MSLYEHSLYQEDLQLISSFASIPWNRLPGSSILLSSATGMIGSLLVDAIL